MKNYKDLIVWKKAHAFVLTAYKTSKSFPKEEQYNLTSQLRRAATSIPTNLAEGCGKFTQRDFASYLQNALGSSMEVEYLTFLSFELGYLEIDNFKRMDSGINEVKAMLISLLTKVRKEDTVKKK
ncbi:four helix bundle protein [Chryseosolibacter indicus]|uniref:Four helix bundle protein n=1 Tax=Chryseosolibacter indicus TaxID=2782351 RepID=A0ABS5VU78_9BACT|nr:four helix bundle protein [Chryseosolibacter indicus]MBT1703546.1 four helix bundle protein [Chryseosolibacter indicus]